MDNTRMDVTADAIKPQNAWIPEGYVSVAQDGKHYVVPDFMVPDLLQTLAGQNRKQDLKAFEAAGAVHTNTSDEFEIIGEGKIMVPTIPGSSDRERLAAHGEVLALQSRLGISYKDAAHRLYMAQMVKMKTRHEMLKAFADLKALTKDALDNVFESVSELDAL